MKLSVTSSPQIRSNVTTRRLMGDVLIALLPALAAGVWAFGVRALAVCCLTMAVCAATELLASLAMKKPVEANLSALVTGLLLAMTLPATVPYWVAAIGGVFAILAAKFLCGGLAAGSELLPLFGAGVAVSALCWLVLGTLAKRLAGRPLRRLTFAVSALLLALAFQGLSGMVL